MKYPILLAIFLLGNLGAAELREYPFYRDALPAEDDGISLTREMIRIFGEGKEPK